MGGGASSRKCDPVLPFATPITAEDVTLQHFIAKGDLKMVSYLMYISSDVDIDRALITAMKAKHLDIVNCLLERGASDFESFRMYYDETTTEIVNMLNNRAT